MTSVVIIFFGIRDVICIFIKTKAGLIDTLDKIKVFKYQFF